MRSRSGAACEKRLRAGTPRGRPMRVIVDRVRLRDLLPTQREPRPARNRAGTGAHSDAGIGDQRADARTDYAPREHASGSKAQRICTVIAAPTRADGKTLTRQKYRLCQGSHRREAFCQLLIAKFERRHIVP